MLRKGVPKLGRWINIKTSVPGPKSIDWIRKLQQYVPSAVAVQFPILVDRADGVTVIDIDGNVFLDLTGGLGALNVGHANPRVVQMVQDQAARFLHTDFSNIPYTSLIQLAERLVQRIPGAGPRKAFFFNSGAEAIENAIKIARLYTGRPAVMAFEGGFHGRTYLALSLTGRSRPYKAGLGPFAPEVYRLPFPYVYRKPYPVSDDEYGEICAAAMERAFETQVAPQDVAAVVVEPVQGECGFIVPPAGFLLRVQEICRRHGILLIVDEVQTGFGRTGRWFAYEHFNIDPDLICLGKSLAGGLPLSAVVGRAAVMDAAPEGSIGGTYAGNPVACAAALGVIGEMEALDLPRRAQSIGAFMRQRFLSMAERFPVIGDVRGLGAMLALELVHDRATKQPAPDKTKALIGQAMQRGVLLLKAGIFGNVIRMLAPLIISEEQATEALDIVEECLTHI